MPSTSMVTKDLDHRYDSVKTIPSPRYHRSPSGSTPSVSVCWIFRATNYSAVPNSISWTRGVYHPRGGLGTRRLPHPDRTPDPNRNHWRCLWCGVVMVAPVSGCCFWISVSDVRCRVHHPLLPTPFYEISSTTVRKISSSIHPTIPCVDIYSGDANNSYSP